MSQQTRLAALDFRLHRKVMLLSCAAMAVASAALASQANAQAFQGTPTTASGTVGYDRATAGVETITIGSNTATINWAPSDTSGTGNIDFLPFGNVATYINDPNSTTNYTVLNRIVPTDPTRAIEFNGTVLSKLTDGLNTSTGGNVWFYSPGGIIIGANAIFDVGGLLLTTADLPDGFTADSTGFSGQFVAPSGSTSKIQILDGAQLNALQQNSYIALVAPRIEQGGNVQVNGAAAYAAGEQLTMTMNQGLFDIQIDVGTDDPNGIVHTGTTGGPASGGASEPHRVYMVAVPKNQAMTMLLGGNVGFQPATVAGVENGQVVLSAGFSINDTGSGYNRTASGTGSAGIDILPGSYTSDLFGYARGDIAGTADKGGIDFSGDVDLESIDSPATGNVSLEASNGQSITVGGNLTMMSDPVAASQVSLTATGGGSVDIAGDLTMTAIAAEGSGGDASILADGGTLNIDGIVTINVDGIYSSAATSDSFAGDGHGGAINVDAYNEGSITAGGLAMSANGVGQDGSGGASATAGSGYGGNISVNADSGGAITINGDVDSVASGFGGNMLETATTGGSGQGGYSTISVGDGTVSIAGNLTMNAEGWGGTVGEGGTGGSGGSGFGGNVTLYTYGPGSISVDGNSNIVANAYGGDGQTGGDAYGGVASVSGYDGTIALGATNYIAARGEAGSATFGFGGAGGYGQGGSAFIAANAELGNIEVPPSHVSISGGDVILDASGVGGEGGAGDGATIAAGAGGDASGGLFNGEIQGGAYALAQSDGASLYLGDVTAIAEGIGGAGGAGGTGQTGGDGGIGYGGLAQAGEYDPFGLGATFAIASYGDLVLEASGFGGDGGAGPAGAGDGGNGFGGFAVVNARGTVDAGSADLEAAGYGGAGSNGGIAAGGDVFAQAYSDSALTFTGDLSLFAAAIGGDGSNGVGGDAYGGYAEAGTTGDGASLSIAGAGSLQVSAIGSDGTTNGGSAYAGATYFRTTGASSATAGSLDARANAFAGAGGTSDGLASGGSVYVLADPLSTMTLGDVALEALGPDGLVDLNWGGGLVVPAGIHTAAVQTPGVVYASNITVNSGGDFAVGDVNAIGAVDLTAAGTGYFYGTLSAPTITVTSADVDVESGASLGVSGVTNLITFNAISDAVYLGGPEGVSAPGEYHLSEAGDIESDSAVLNAVGTGGGPTDVNVLDAILEGSETAGGGISHVTVNTDGSIIIKGQVDFVNAGAADSLTLNAGDSIEVITDSGGISMTDSDGVLAGTLTLNAPDIWSASQALIDKLEANPNFTGRADALRTNDGPVNPDGYIRAGGIVVKVGDTFFVQNSGTLDEFAGITVGDGGLSIISTAGQTTAAITTAAVTGATVDIYGRQQKSDGTEVLNGDFAAEVPTTGQFTADSTINDCPLGGCPPPPPPPPPTNPTPPELGPESILGPIFLMTSPRLSILKANDESNSDSGLDSDLIDTGPLSNDEDIDEPVTSGADAPDKTK